MVSKEISIEGTSFIPEVFANKSGKDAPAWVRRIELTANDGNVFSPGQKAA